MRHSLLRFATVTAIALGMAGPAGAAPQPIVVPTDYPSIQAAIDAAKPGRTVMVLAGTYTEQISISKSLSIVGAGRDATIIRAPATLVPGQLGSPSLVEIFGNVSVSMSELTVSGPGPTACGAANVLRWGVRVAPGAHLDLLSAAVRDIHNTPMAMCTRSGTAISVGSATPGSLPASITVDHSEVTNYQTTGIIVLGAGSWGNVSQSLVAGPGHAGGVPTNGIELVGGAVGVIAHNTVSGNVCPEGFPEVCGPDFFTQFQEAGIGAGGSGPGTIISHNLLVGNQIGLFISEVDSISQNIMVDNDYYGMGLVGVDSGTFTVDGGRITGTGGGVWVAAILVDMNVRLNKVDFSGLSGNPVEILEDGGFTATVTGNP